ncbi:MAG: FkbM family methyltransferase, partial [Candidatus Omnitrophica bacterium]|nr:FkbM family methyltransferase [Candidatus Omnitrophota bacterium]
MLLEKFYYMLKFSPFLQNLAKRALFKLPHREIIVCHYGQKLKVDLSELSGFYLYFEKEYDDYIFDFLNKRISKYERVIDVGANIGIYSIYFGARAKRVDSFEPVPEIANKLVYNINLNELKNVIVHKACVGEKSGKVSFILPSKANQGIGRISFEDGDIIELPCISLDDFLGGVLDEPTLIKIDIEGAELLALTGAK